jgi:EAL domain-containing protein (putative c-di-GMP-specific phosphodiesterase class I)
LSFFETSQKGLRVASGTDRGAALPFVGLFTPPPLRLPANAGGGLVLLYQPIVRIGDRQPVMVEALARWQAADGVIGAEVLVTAAESAGLTEDLTAAVARRAIRELAGLLSSLRLRVSINMPLEVLERRDIASWLARHLSVPRRLRHRVALELTETSPVHDRSRLALALRRLRRAGHQVLLDDLQPGDGRRHLVALPFSGVKLDRSVVERLATAAHTRHWLRGVARQARRRRMTVTAEGVSSPAHWAALRGGAVSQAQGYLVARPLPADDLTAWAIGWRGAARQNRVS